MKKNTSSAHMTFEDALQDPTMAHFHEAIHFLEENENKILFPKKYMAGLRSIVERDVKDLFEQSPSTPPIQVVRTMLEGMNENLPSEMILEITAFILKEWISLTTSPQTVGELQTV